MRHVLTLVVLSLLTVPAARAQEYATPEEDAACWERYRRDMAAADLPTAIRWLLPWFEIDRRLRSGKTTPIMIRNVSPDRANNVTLVFRAAFGDLLARREHRLDPAEVLTLNRRNIPEFRPSRRSFFPRGFVTVESTRLTEVAPSSGRRR